MKKLLVLTILLAISLTGSFANAQEEDECPEGLICIPYGEAIIELDPACGVIQTLVIEERESTVRSLEGETSEFHLKGVVVMKMKDLYTVAAEFNLPAEADLEDVRFGDVGCVEWQTTNE